MSKTITTSYLKAKYKGKYYYLAMYCTYSIDSTDFNSKKLTFSAGFRTKTRKLSIFVCDIQINLLVRKCQPVVFIDAG